MRFRSARADGGDGVVVEVDEDTRGWQGFEREGEAGVAERTDG